MADARGSKNARAVIELDGSGVAWIRGKQVKVIEIVIDRLVHGGDLRGIRSRFPSLTAKQISAALDYFRDHRSEFQAEIERRWEQIRSSERFYTRHTRRKKQ